MRRKRMYHEITYSRGKLKKPYHIEAIGTGEKSKRLHIRDKKSGLVFLVDTGSDISIIPRKNKEKGEPSEFVLYAANNSRIDTFGTKHMHLNLGLLREFTWHFHIATVPYPILGADFLSFYDVAVDLKNKKLIDSCTGLKTNGIVKSVSSVSINTVNKTSKFAHIFAEFPEITNPTAPMIFKNSQVSHRITTTGQPIAQRARKLCPERRKVAKDYFQLMCKSGRCSPSNASWASPIHMQKKKTAHGAYAGTTVG